MNRMMAIVPMLMLALLTPGLPAAEAQSTNVSGWACVAQTNGCGGPVPGATLVLESAGIVADVGKESWTTESDKGGYFGFADIPDGDYVLRVTRAGMEPAEIQVTVDGRASFEVPMVPQDIEVNVTVEDQKGAPAAEVSIDANSNWGSSYARATTNKDGLATLLLKAGNYNLYLNGPQGSASMNNQFLDGSPLTASLAGSGDSVVSGVVRDQDGAPVAEASVNLWVYGNYESKPEGNPEPAEPGADPAPSTMPAYCCDSQNVQGRTGADGSFRFYVTGGEVNVNVWKEGHVSYYDHFTLTPGDDRTLEIELHKFPDKTARIEGKVVGKDGNAVPYVSISIQNVEWGVYECSSYDGATIQEPKPTTTAEPASEDASEGSTGDEARTSIAYPEPYPYPGCAIAVQPDGTFSGMVTPGYSTINVYHDHWRSCSETRNADGSGSTTCGPEYLSHVQTMELSEGTTKLDITLRQRAPADAKVQGYIVDQATKKAIPGAQVYFHSQDSYSWGHATTDKDGSYAIKLRSGTHTANVYVEGYFAWQGMVDVPSGSEVGFDIFLKEGESRYGHCCYAYAEGDTAVAPSGRAPPSAPASAPSGASPQPAVAPGSAPSSQSGTQSESFEDLGGGLGPYDPEARSNLEEGPSTAPSQDSPPIAIALVGAVLLVLAALRRK